jgi:hypothetical protein
MYLSHELTRMQSSEMESESRPYTVHAFCANGRDRCVSVRGRLSTVVSSFKTRSKVGFVLTSLPGSPALGYRVIKVILGLAGFLAGSPALFQVCMPPFLPIVMLVAATTPVILRRTPLHTDVVCEVVLGMGMEARRRRENGRPRLKSCFNLKLPGHGPGQANSIHLGPPIRSQIPTLL